MAELFAGAQISDIRLMKDRETNEPMGRGHVDFARAEDLAEALKKHGMPFNGRQVRVDVAEPRRGPGGPGGPPQGGGGQGGGPPGADGRYAGPSEFEKNSWEGTTESRAGRPRLQLKKRSAAAAPSGKKTDATKSSIFGGAKPREEGQTAYDKKRAAERAEAKKAAAAAESAAEAAAE